MVAIPTILVIDDDPDIRADLQMILEDQGYRVLTAPDGQAGLRCAQAELPHLIICDMMMPTLPGDMFFRAVERMRPHLCDRFIFMTGHRGSPKVNDFIRSVNGTILSKPFQVDDLLEMIAFVQVRTAVT